MFELFTDILSIILIGAGLLFFFGGGVGLIRFPDFYTRMHAAGKGDTLSSLLVLIGFALYHIDDIAAGFEDGTWYKPALLILKLFAISFFIMTTSPTATHALIDAGYSSGIKPLGKDDELEIHRKPQ